MVKIQKSELDLLKQKAEQLRILKNLIKDDLVLKGDLQRLVNAMEEPQTVEYIAPVKAVYKEEVKENE